MSIIAAWAYRWRKVAAGVLPVIGLCLLGEAIGFESVQLWTIFVTLIPTLLFIVAYLPEQPERHWFGTSLLNLAFAVLSVVIAAMLVRVVGPEFRGKTWLVTFWIGLTLTSMTMRTFVLISDQIRDERGFGWDLVRFWRWLTRR